MLMTRNVRHVTWIAIALVLSVVAPAAAQPPAATPPAETRDSCGATAGGFNFWLANRLCTIARSAPKDAHVEPPASLAGSTTLVEKAGHPDIVSLALGLASAGDDAGTPGAPTTMTVSAFAIRSSVSGENPMNPEVYSSLRNWRRFSFTVGRAGASGDAPEARVFGVKALVIDRRDVTAASAAGRLEAVMKELVPLAAATGDAHKVATAFIARTLANLTDAGDVIEFTQDRLGLATYAKTIEMLEDDELAELDALLRDTALRRAEAQADIAREIRAIGRAPQLALTYQALVRPADADDEHHFGVLFDVALASRLVASVNGILVRTDHRTIEDTNVLKAGGQLQFDLRRVARLQDVLTGRDPVTISVAGLGEWYSDERTDIAKIQVKLTLPLPKPLSGLKIPVSLTVANRTELIDERELRGNVGFTVDFSKLQNMLGALRR
jgi:hypothetical protein